MERVRRAVASVRARTPLVPRVAIVSGPGIEMAGDLIASEARVALPGPALAELHLGHIEGVPVVYLAHADDQRSGQSVVGERGFPTRVLGLLGAEVLLLTGACLALDPSVDPGDLAIVDDHLNLLGENPLIGPNLNELGPRFPDLSEVYDRSLQTQARESGTAEGISLSSGVYAAVPDTNLRTSAEYSMLRRLGADLMGTDLVGEAIVARHMGMRVLGLLVVTDRGPTGDDTRYRPDFAEPRIARVVRGLMARIA